MKCLLRFHSLYLNLASSKENFESSDSVIFKGAGNAFLETCFNDKNGDLLLKLNNDFSAYLQNEMKIYKISEFDQFSQILTFEEKFLLSNIDRMWNIWNSLVCF